MFCPRRLAPSIVLAALAAFVILNGNYAAASPVEIVRDVLNISSIKNHPSELTRQPEFTGSVRNLKRGFDGNLNPILGFSSKANGVTRGTIEVQFPEPSTIGSIAIWNGIGSSSNNNGVKSFYVVLYRNDTPVFRSRTLNTDLYKQGDDSARRHTDRRNGPDLFGLRYTARGITKADIVLNGSHSGNRIAFREFSFYDTRTVDLYYFGGQSNASGMYTTYCFTADSDIDAGSECENKLPNDQRDTHILTRWGYPRKNEYDISDIVGDNTGKGACNNDGCRQTEWVSPRKQWHPRNDRPWNNDGRTGIYFYGPEIEFARCSAENQNWQFLYKYAVPGQSIRQWGAGQARRESTINEFKDAFRSLKMHKLEPRVRGIIWIQGETDANRKGPLLLYRSRIQEFVNHLRSEIADLEENTGCSSDGVIRDEYECTPVVFSFNESHRGIDSYEAHTIRTDQESIGNSAFVSVQSQLGNVETPVDSGSGWGDKYGHLTPGQMKWHGREMCLTLNTLLNE